MAIIDWQIMSNGLSKEIGNGIILYGASGSGEKMVMFLEELGLSDRIIAVSDSNKEKWNRDWMKYRVLSPYDLKNISNDAIIVITSVYLKEISEFLQSEVKCQQRICSIFSFKMAIHYDIMNNHAVFIENSCIKNYKIKYNFWKSNTISLNETRRENYFFNMIKYIIERNESIILCGIQKTGNTSLRNSFNADDELNNIIFAQHRLYYNYYSFKIVKNIFKYFINHKIKIISGIREPIERIISQKWQRIVIPYQNDDVCMKTLVNYKYETFIDNAEYFNQNKKVISYFYFDIANWFKDQIERIFEINVFDYPFDKNNGYSVIEKDNVSIFLYRLDKLSFLEKEIADFAEVDSFKLIKANEALNKKYVFAYNQYLEQVKVNQDFFEALVNSKGMTHFYTEKECEKYKEKWKDKLV